jgi:hypothetical protein
MSSHHDRRPCPRCGIERQVNSSRPHGLCRDCRDVTATLGEQHRWASSPPADCQHRRTVTASLSRYAVAVQCRDCRRWTIVTTAASEHPWIDA